MENCTLNPCSTSMMTMRWAKESHSSRVSTLELIVTCSSGNWRARAIVPASCWLSEPSLVNLLPPNLE